MATLEEVSNRLMKPAKELADWNFPLAMVLEQYYTLLKEEEDVNLSNAALVVQNCGNVYDRRIDDLHHGVSGLNESLAEQEETTPKESKKSAKDKKASIDFGDFEPIDFTKFISKNTNMKARIGNKNAVKLLTQRFPQLENSRSSLPIEVYDIHGDVVGKKYDFRCNEYLTASGMLVEHLTPEDFLEPSPVQNTTILPISTDSGIGETFNTTQTAVETENGFSERVLCQDNFEDSRVVQERDTGLLDSSFASSYDSGVGSSIQSSTVRPDSVFSNSADSHWDLPQSRPESSLSTADVTSLAGGDPSPLDNLDTIIASDEKIVESTKETIGKASQTEDLPLEEGTNENREETGDCTANEKTQCDSESTENAAAVQNVAVTENVANKRISPRRRKAPVNVIDAVNNLNPKPWEPIPFDGIAEKVSNPRAEFTLPCPISLLQSKETRKRKLTPGKQRKTGLKTQSKTEGGTSPKKMTLYSPTRQLFHPFKKEELEDYQICLEECLKNRPNCDDYEAVMTDTSLDLLGYRAKDHKSDQETIPLIEPDFPVNIPKSDLITTNGILTNDIDAPDAIESTDSAVDDFPMPDTPESSDNASEISPITPPQTYRSRIEKSVRDIYHNAEVRTAEEERVIKFHEYMEPRLKENERRPTFDLKQYSARVINKIKSQTDRKIEFADMVSNEERIEVARYFSISLKLANEYNLHIDTNHNVEGNLTLALFDKDR